MNICDDVKADRETVSVRLVRDKEGETADDFHAHVAEARAHSVRLFDLARQRSASTDTPEGDKCEFFSADFYATKLFASNNQAPGIQPVLMALKGELRYLVHAFSAMVGCLPSVKIVHGEQVLLVSFDYERIDPFDPGSPFCAHFQLLAEVDTSKGQPFNLNFSKFKPNIALK